MKKSIFTLLFLAIVACVSAQSLQFELKGHVYANGESIICDSVSEMGELVQEMQIRNLTSNSLQVMVKREIIQMVDGTENSFCWGNCFAPTVDVSSRPVTMDAGAVSVEGLLSFHQLLDPTYSSDPSNYAVGTSVVKYYAFPADNEEDKVCIEVWFAYNAEGVSEKPSISFSHAYPNPASSMVRFDYNLSAADNVSAAVYNLLGQEVMREQLNNMQGVVSFSVADLNDGIYFCNLFVNGQAVKTEKFVVKKF